MFEVYDNKSSVKTNYNSKDNAIMNNETNTIKSEQMEFDFDTKANANNVDTEQDTPLFSAVLTADPELASDAKKKMDAENEKRINTLRENGAKGGRPPIDRGGLAKMCLDAVFTKHGQCLLRHYKGDWYLYMCGCYSQIPEEEIDKKLTGYLLRSGAEVVSSAIRRDVLGNLKSDALCGLTVDKYTKPCLISTGEPAFGFVSMKNGIINIDEIANALENGLTPPAVRPHTPDLFTTVRLPYEYDPTATCPKFEAYLEGVQPKAENREILQMLAGLLLTPDMTYNVAFFLYGVSGTGKSVFLTVMTEMIGKENTCCVPLGEFANRFSTWPLVETLANIVGDMPFMPESGRSAEVEGVLKEVTCGGRIKVERKGRDRFEANVTARCVFGTNSLPYFADKSGAIRDRLRIIPFNQVFRGTDKQNLFLEEELREERSGILNWALRGLVKLREYTATADIPTFPHCEDGRRILEEHLADCDHEGSFLLEETEANPDRHLGSLDVYHAYRDWAKNLGYNPVGDKKFREAVLRVYPNATYGRLMKGCSKTTVIHGIYWTPDRPEHTTVAPPIASLVQREQMGISNERGGQPNLGF